MGRGVRNMIIPITDKYRISSDRNSWTVQKYVGKRKDGKDEWESLYYCADFQSALIALAELQIRLIDSSVSEEIKTAIREIRDECITVSEVFRELSV